jgi:adenosylcobinamide-GDP ribazoletransferase
MMTKDILAAFMFFTRLPLGRVCKIPADSFKRIVAYWPLAGLLTGGVMTAVYLLAVCLGFHVITAVLLAFTGRLLLTGALHEDGLADFLDGFGGGGGARESILSIMKDSHIGVFGTLGLMLYVLMWISSVLILMQRFDGSEYILFFTCDIWSKWCASQITNLLPYSRKKEDSKINSIYERMSPAQFITGFTAAILPFVYIIAFKSRDAFTCPAIIFSGAIAPLITMLLLTLYMKRLIRGYTGDCCGAVFLLCELSYLLTLNCLWKFF